MEKDKEGAEKEKNMMQKGDTRVGKSRKKLCEIVNCGILRATQN